MKRSKNKAIRMLPFVASALMCTVAVTARQMGPAPVRTGLVQSESVQEKRIVIGDVVASRRANVATQEGGIVIEMHVKEGHVVRSGDVLAKLDSRRLTLQRSQAEADLLAAKAVVKEKEAEQLNSERDVELIRDAFNRNAANAKELRDAEAAYDVANARMVTAQRQVEAITSRINLLNDRLEDMTIKAPFDGAVVACHVELGEWVAEGDSVIELLDIETVEVWVQVPQQVLTAVRSTDDPVIVRSDSSQSLFESKTKRIVPQVDPKARTFTLVLTVENDNHELIPGGSVTAWVPTGDLREHQTVPKNAVLRNETGFYVYVVRHMNPEEPASAAPVSVDLLFPHQDRFVVQAPGLNEGDQTIVEGNERLFPMAPVMPIETQQTKSNVTESES